MKNFIILKEMSNNRKMNNGQPIIALIESKYDDYTPIAMESNNPAKKEYDKNGRLIYDEHSYEGHAEWLCIDKLEDKLKKGHKIECANLYITTTPCNKCTWRIRKLKEKYNFVFNEIIYLFDKNSATDNDWKDLHNIRKYVPTEGREVDELSKMESHWRQSNLSNRIKTLERKLKSQNSINNTNENNAYVLDEALSIEGITKVNNGSYT